MKQIFTISPGTAADAAELVLSFRAGRQHIGFAVSNPVSGELLQLACYTTDETGVQDLEEVMTAHPELRQAFSAVLVGYDYPQSLLIPFHLYKEEELRLQLEVMYGINGSYATAAAPVPGWQLQNAYAVPGDVQEWIAAHFPSARRCHYYSAGIRQLAADGAAIHADFHTHHFSIIAARDNQLLLAQTFAYTTAADVVYHLLQVCEAFALPQKTVRLELSGLVEKDSGLYRSLVQYFLDIRFRNPAWRLPAENSTEVPPHFFTSLNDLAACAS
ncbi:MAG: DUF3822 family protein [Chitinophagaceae bacterium]